MDFLIENWPMIVIAICALYAVFIYVKDGELKSVKKWLLWAVTVAEKELGGGTGELKLRKVYDMFLSRYPWLSKFVPFERFDKLVTESLKEMEKVLEQNEKVKKYVEGE